MENNICVEHLVSIGMATFSQYKQQILKEMAANNIPITNTVTSTASTEAIIRAVAVMIENSFIDIRQ